MGGGEIAQLIPFCANCTANDYACFKLISFPKPTKTAAVFSEFYFQSSIFMGSDIIFFIYVNFLCVLFDVIGSFCSTCIRINYFLFFFLAKGQMGQEIILKHFNSLFGFQTTTKLNRIERTDLPLQQICSGSFLRSSLNKCMHEVALLIENFSVCNLIDC